MEMEVDSDVNSSNKPTHGYDTVMNVENRQLQEHLEPRIGSSFQADIPAVIPAATSTTTTSPATTPLQATLQHRPNYKKDNKFISFCKHLTKESAAAANFHSEEDETLLTYLQQHADGDVELGKLMLINQLTAGENCSHRRFQKFINRAHRTKFKQSQEKVLWQYLYDRAQPCSSFLGDLRSDVGGRNEYFASIPMTANTERDRMLSSGLSCTTGRGYADRSEMKVRWRSLMASAEGMLENACSYSPAIVGSTRPTLRELLDLLTTAHGMPMPSESPGESFVENTVRTLNQILTLTSVARDCLASLHDVLHYDATAQVEGKGIDLERVKRALKRANKAPVEVSEAEVVRRVVKKASAWEQEVEEMLRLSSEAMAGDVLSRIDYLTKAEQLVVGAKSLGPLSELRSRIILEKKIERAYVVKRRISGWDNENGKGNTENIKVIASMVREVNRIGLYFSEVSRLMKVHASAEEWMERAAIVNRNRSSLLEVEQLIESGEHHIPVNLLDYLGKLRAKARAGRDWIRVFDEAIPCEIAPGNISGSYVSCLKLIRDRMNESEEKRKKLIMIKSEGAVLPLDIDQFKLLSLEIDAYKWSAEARSMLEMTKTQKIKLEDVRKHIERIATLRSKLPLNKKEKSDWTPEFEDELFALVNAADKLLEEYEGFIGDSGKKRRVSLGHVRQLKDAVNGQPLDLGSAAEHILSVLVASENWVREHRTVLKHCKICTGDFDDKQSGTFATTDVADIRAIDPVQKITLAMINSAVSQGLELDLEEMFKLKTIANRIRKWIHRSMQVAPLWTTETRDRVSVDDKPDMEELFDLVEEAKALPVNVDEELELLKKQISLVEEWRLTASKSMKVISQKFRIEHRKRAVETSTGCNFDEAEENSETASSSSSSQNHSHNTRKRTGVSKSPGSGFADVDIREAQEHAALFSVPLTEPLNSAPEMSMDDMINNLLQASSKINVGSLEEELVEELVEVWEWYNAAKQILTFPNDVIANPDSIKLKELIQKGIDLCTSESPDETNFVLQEMCSSWKNLLLSEGYRLDRLWRRRNEFQAWREKAQNFVSPTEKGRYAMSTLKSLEEQCHTLPEGIALVQSFKEEMKTAYDWFIIARDALDHSKKMALPEIKKVISRGEKIKVIPNDELKSLKQGIRQAKAWAMRARRVNPDSNEAEAAAEVKRLLEEYVYMLVEIPDEIAKLKKATSIYCLCRETHSSGLMVACDECDEWYHGPCVGLTQALADRCEKYTCVRCLVTKSMRTSAEKSVAKIRKWTDWGELIKARQVEGQKHQRKARRERREIEKRTAEIEEATRVLSNLTEVEGGKANRFAPKITPQIPSIIAVAVSNQCHPTPSSPESEAKLQSTSSEPPNSAKQEDVIAVTHSAEVAGTSGIDDEKTVAKEKIKKAQEIIKGCNERLSELEGLAHQRKDREEKENSMSSTLRVWLSKVHINIFKPASEEQIATSRPLPEAKISECMQTLINESISLKIDDFPDIRIVNNSFNCFAWCLYAHTILDKKPKIEEIQVLLEKSEGITFPDERALKIIRGIYSRCKSWQDRARAALLPSTETNRPFDVTVLSKLFRELRNIPLFIAEESRVWNTIDDKGERHCLCGGPSDGTFMLACDKCGIWFHGACIGLTKENGESLSKWHCPPCTEKYGELSLVYADQGAENGIEGNSIEKIIRIPSPHAPDVNSLWPPLDVDKVAVELDAIGKSEENPPPPKKSPASVKFARGKRSLGSATKRSLAVGPPVSSIPEPAIPDQATSSIQAAPLTMAVPSQTLQITAPVAQAAVPMANPFIAAPNLSALLNTGMMAPEATMMLSGTIAALNAGALLANSALFPGSASTNAANISPATAATKRQRVDGEEITNEWKRTKVDDHNNMLDEVDDADL